MKRSIGFTVIALALGVATNARAANITFNDKNAFFAGAAAGGFGNIGTETFDSLVIGSADTQTLVFGATGITGAVGNSEPPPDDEDPCSGFARELCIETAVVNGRHSVSPKSYLLPDNSLAFQLTFNQAVRTFGFYGIDIGDEGAILRLGLFNGQTEVGTFDIGSFGALNGNELYFGVLADSAFNRVTFGYVQSPNSTLDDIFAFDDFSVGVEPAPVPEPTSLLLLGTGVAALARRRRAQAKQNATK